MSTARRGPDLLTITLAAGTLGLLALGVAYLLAPAAVTHLGHRVAGRLGHGPSARAVGLSLRLLDDPRATEWLTLAADRGDPVACVTLADDLFAPPVERASGQVVEEERPELSRARELYARAANAGDVVAAQRLGLLLVAGAGGPADPAEGARWLRAAADRAHEVETFQPEPRRLRAMLVAGLAAFDDPFTCLGRLHEVGLGAPQDDAAAAEHYRAALAWAARPYDLEPSAEARMGGPRAWLLALLDRRPDLRRPGDPFRRWSGCRLPAR